MPPEAIKELTACRDHFIKNLFQGGEEDLQRQANQALTEKRYGDLKQISAQLDNLNRSWISINEGFDKVEQVLYENNLDKVDIPALTTTAPLSSTEIKEKEPPEIEEMAEEIVEEEVTKSKRPKRYLPGIRPGSRTSPFRKEATYVKDADAKAMLAYITMGPATKEPLYHDINDVVPVMLMPDKITDEDKVKTAQNRVVNYRGKFIRDIKYVAERTGAKTVKKLFGDAAESAWNSEWRSFYQRAVEDFGDMSPEDFINKVLKAKG